MAKRKSKKMTANQILYSKEVNRIKQAVKRAKKRGYIFNDDVIPQTPKRITKKAIERIAEIKPRHLYAKAKYIDSETGEILSGTEGRKTERKKASEKAKETRKRKRKSTPNNSTNESSTYYPNGGDIIYGNVVDSFIARLSEPTPEWLMTPRGKYVSKSANAIEESQKSKTTLLSLTRSVISQIGESALGWRLEEKADDVNTLTNYVLYGSDASRIASACAELATIINGGALSMQQLMDIAEQEEANEDWENPI